MKNHEIQEIVESIMQRYVCEGYRGERVIDEFQISDIAKEIAESLLAGNSK